MVRRLCILCLLVALWPGLAFAQSAALVKAFNQSQALYKQGRYGEAERFARKALELSRRVFGTDHPNTGTLLTNLAALQQIQGRYAEAEPLHKRALAIREKALGPEHPDVATSLNNLGGHYLAQGRYAEGEPLYRRSLAIREKALGPEHPSVGASLNNLALLYQTQGRYAEAEPRRIRVPEMPIALRPRLPTLGRQSIRGFRELCTKGFLDSAAQPPIPGFRPGICHTVAAARAASGLENDGWALYGTDIVAPTSRSPSRRSQLSRLREAPEGNLE